VLSTIPYEYYTAQATLNGFVGFLDHPYLGVRDKRLQIGGLLSDHGIEPGQTMFIGDMQHDIETARHGGVLACAVLTGYNGLDQLRSSAPDLIVEHLGELQSILERNGFELSAPRGAEVPVVTVGALIYDAFGQVLMVRTRKWSGLWGIPGGKVKYGETLEAAVRREIKEETGLDLTEVRFALVQDCIGSSEFYREAHFVLLNYTACRQGQNKVCLNDEAQEYRWVPVFEAMTMPLNRPTRVLLDSLPR
jgi:ADP-ribose pyrophosphatase YjhB (NUDIX family)